MQQMIAFGFVSMTVAVPTPTATPDGEIIGPLKSIAWNSKRLAHGLAMLPVDVVKRAAKRTLRVSIEARDTRLT